MFAYFVKLFFKRGHKKIAPFGAISLDSEVAAATLHPVFRLVLPVGVEVAVLAALVLVVLPVPVEVGIIGRLWIGRGRFGLIGHCLHDGDVFFVFGGIGREWQDHGGGGVGGESRSLAAGTE